MEARENNSVVAGMLTERVKQMAFELAHTALEKDGSVLQGDFVELENLAVDLSKEMGQLLLRELLVHQANRSEEEPHLCPQCGKPCESKRPRKRQVTTRTGQVTWHEPVQYCRPCRRSFSPSVPPIEDSDSQ